MLFDGESREKGAEDTNKDEDSFGQGIFVICDIINARNVRDLLGRS